MGELDWDRTIAHRVSFSEAPAMYERINTGDLSVLKMVIDREQNT